MTNLEIVKKLIGNIQPTGDASRDPERLQNLKEMCTLVNNIVQDIDDVCYRNQHSQQHSIRESVEYAKHFLTHTLGICE